METNDLPSSPPKLSVLMPVYNRKEYAAIAVESVLQQTFRDFEFIIIDDGSTDGVTGLLRDYAARDSRIVLIEQENAGYSHALNRGLKATRGEWIARMDSDDICLPDRFQKQVEFLNGNPGVVAVGGQAIAIDEDGDPLAPLNQLLDDQELQAKLLGILDSPKGALIHPTVMMRRDAVLAIGGYRTEFEPAEDRDLWLRLSERGGLANLPDVVLHYRTHGGSVSQTRAARQYENARRAISEARQRRGLSVSAEVQMWRLEERQASAKSPSASRALYAARHRNYQTARKHAWRSLSSDPLNATAWKALIIGVLGTRLAKNLTRIRNGLSKGRPCATSTVKMV